MNFVVKNIFIWYSFISLLSLFSATTLSVFDISTAIIIMWIIFIFFHLTSNYRCSSRDRLFLVSKFEKILYENEFRFLFFALIAFGCCLYSVYYYTGLSVFSLLKLVISGDSLYTLYQEYFKENSIGQFSFLKIPAILSQVFMKLALVFAFYLFIVSNVKLTFLNKTCLSIVILSYVIFSVSRGTSFEFFEILMLTWFSFQAKGDISPSVSSSMKRNMFLLALSIFFLSIYSYNVSARYQHVDDYVINCVSPDMCLDRESFLYYASPGLAILSLKLSGYFVIGLHYTSYFFENIFFSSSINTLEFILPFSSVYTELSVGFLCDSKLECGPTWKPDFTAFTIKYGIFINLASIVLIFSLCRLSLKSWEKKVSFVDFSILFFCFLFIISLPIGNFISSSSSNFLTFLILITLKVLYGKYYVR
ncbi:hypothetical protein AB4381_12175 [Vibrio splendidus]